MTVTQFLSESCSQASGADQAATRQFPSCGNSGRFADSEAVTLAPRARLGQAGAARLLKQAAPEWFKDKQELSRKEVGKILGQCKDRWQEASWHRARGDRA